MADNKDTKKISKKKNRLDDIKITDADKALFKFIGKHESFGGDPDTLYGGYKGEPNKPITQMTLKEVWKLQEDMKDSGSSAVGAHQFLQSVLKEEAKAAGLTGDELFEHDLQNKLMKHRLKRVRGYDKFLNGKISEEKFATNLSQEFASMPVPKDMKGHTRDVKAGESYYAGDNVGNKSGTDPQAILGTLTDVKDLFTGSQIGHASVNPEEIVNNPNLDDGTKEELLKMNESEGLPKEALASLEKTQPSVTEYGTPGGYSGALNLNSLLADQDTTTDKKKAKQETNPQDQETTNQAQQALGYTGEIGAFASDFNLIDKQFEQGGNLNAEPGANVLTEYNQGGQHEQNPHGGIPVGQNSQGGQNLVEQGETRFGDYIYSNEYELDEEDASRFNINPSHVGKSYSDISKEINEQMTTRPYDRLVKKTAEGALNKLMMAQETVKQQEQQELMALNQELDMLDQDE